MQSIGLPTYCLVVTITENVSRITDDMHLKTVRICQHRFKLWIIYCYQWSLNTELSMWMWETLMRVFNLRNMSSMMRFLFLKIIQHDLRFLWWENKFSPWLKDASTLRCVYLGGCHNWGEDDKSLRYVRVKSEKRLILGAMLDTKMVTGSLRHVYHAKPGKTRAPWCWHQPHHRDTWTARYINVAIITCLTIVRW